MYLPLLTAVTADDSSFLNILDFENGKDAVKKSLHNNNEDENNSDCATDSYKSNWDIFYIYKNVS